MSIGHCFNHKTAVKQNMRIDIASLGILHPISFWPEGSCCRRIACSCLMLNSVSWIRDVLSSLRAAWSSSWEANSFSSSSHSSLKILTSSEQPKSSSSKLISETSVTSAGLETEAPGVDPVGGGGRGLGLDGTGSEETVAWGGGGGAAALVAILGSHVTLPTSGFVVDVVVVFFLKHTVPWG